MEGREEFDDERVVDLNQDVSLRDDMRLLLLLLDMLLLEYLHGVNLVGGFLFDQHHLRVAALANYSEQRKIVHRH